MSQPAEPCGCESCVPWALCPDCCAEWDDHPDDLRCRATALAWSTLRTLTGGRVGTCATTVRPCLTEPCNTCLSEAGWAEGLDWRRPLIRDGCWINNLCGTDRCSCERLCEIVLPGLVATVQSVSWGGVELPLSSFRIDNGNRLVRTDGECWPSCQRMDLPLGAPGTLGVTYVPGLVPGVAGEWAAGVLACEFAKACTGQKCRLPAGVTSIARNGVTMEFALGLFSNGLTGIREVDAFIISVNPHLLRTPPKVWSPDLAPTLHRYSRPAVPAPPGASQLVRFSWVEHDPVSCTVLVHGGVSRGWLGSYAAQLRDGPDASAALVGEFDVSAVAEGDDVRMTFTIPVAESQLIHRGSYWWDAQQVGGPTRLRGTANVTAQVTVMP